MKSSLRQLLLLTAFSPLCVVVAGAQPELKTPAVPTPPLVIPKEPIIDPAAKALVEATIAKYKAMKSYSDQTVVTGMGMDSDAKTAWERPNRARIEAKVGKNEAFGLNDGKTLWAFNPAHPGYYVKRAGETDRIFDAGLEANVGAPGQGIITSKYPFADMLRDGLYKLEMGLPEEFEGKPVQVVRAHLAFDDGHNALLILYIGKNDGLLYRVTESVEGAGAIEEVHHAIKVDPVLPAETWTWTPPQNLKPVEYFASLKPDVISTCKPGQKLPGITSPDLTGKMVSLSDFKGKTVLLYFLTVSWGESAKVNLGEIRAKAGDDKLAIICVSLDGRRDRVEDFVKQSAFPYPVLFDGKGWQNAVSQALGVSSHPVYFLIDKDGVIQSVGRRIGEVGFDEKLDALLK